MTREDITAVIASLAPEIRAWITAALADQVTASAALAGRVAALETDRPDTSAIRERLGRLETTAATLTTAAAELGAVRERIAVVEARPAIPGPPGPAGPPGAGLDDIESDGIRTLTLRGADGAIVKSWTFPAMVYQGTYRPNVPYSVGDTVTWDGSLWVCVEQTSAKPIDGAKCWKLAAKRGQPGRDGRDAPALRLGAAS